MTCHSGGEIKLSRPALVSDTISNARLTTANACLTPYANDGRLHANTTADVPLPQVKETFTQLVGDFRYLADSNRTDIAYVTGKLATVIQNPTTGHWEAMKATCGCLIQTPYMGILLLPQKQRPPQLEFVQAYCE